MINIHVTSRAVIIDEGYILLCKTSDLENNFYYLPGGHVENGESAEKTIIREIIEEAGANCIIKRLLGILEHSFKPGENSICHNHEYNFIFEITAEDLKIKNPNLQLEDKFKLEWINLEKIMEIDLKPKSLKNLISDWLKSNNINFYSSMI